MKYVINTIIKVDNFSCRKEKEISFPQKYLKY